MNSNKPEILPCPFCGKSQFYFEDYLADGWIECCGCGAKGPPSYLVQKNKEKAEKEAAEKWNKRA